MRKKSPYDLHPTMKPVELIERAIVNSSQSRATVLDPFGGSGSTLIGCEKTGRQARLIELAAGDLQSGGEQVDATVVVEKQAVVIHQGLETRLFPRAALRIARARRSRRCAASSRRRVGRGAAGRGYQEGDWL